ncbi:hypothetical protein H0H87_011822, partial [Tephrocybe sp. NHM501043]
STVEIAMKTRAPLLTRTATPKCNSYGGMRYRTDNDVVSVPIDAGKTGKDVDKKVVDEEVDLITVRLDDAGTGGAQGVRIR